jgi:hypothetical protein
MTDKREKKQFDGLSFKGLKFDNADQTRLNRLEKKWNKKVIS